MYIEESRGTQYPVGSHIRFMRPYGVHHHGIVIGHSVSTLGPMMVIDNAKAEGVSRRPLAEVAAGNPVEIIASPRDAAHAAYIVERAYSQIGKPYDLFNQNCEHFATWCYSGQPRSLQLHGLVFLAISVGAIALLSRS